MCTLTWKAEAGGYDLFFNRDERFMRPPETAARAGVSPAGVRHVFPGDGDGGGTWLLLNEHGLTVCVLNHYPCGTSLAGRVSRGNLPRMCADCTDAREAADKVRHMDHPDDCAPFHLIALDESGGGAHLRWDGRAMHESPAPGFLTSSSFDTERIQAWREAEYRKLGEPTSARLGIFHRTHDASAGAESVRMRRADACTRSICEVRVRAGERSLMHERLAWDGMQAPPSVTIRL